MYRVAALVVRRVVALVVRRVVALVVRRGWLHWLCVQGGCIYRVHVNTHQTFSTGIFLNVNAIGLYMHQLCVLT